MAANSNTLTELTTDEHNTSGLAEPSMPSTSSSAGFDLDDSTSLVLNAPAPSATYDHVSVNTSSEPGTSGSSTRHGNVVDVEHNPTLIAERELALQSICNNEDDQGGFDIDQVQLALCALLADKSHIYVPGIAMYSEEDALVSLDALASQGYTHMAFSFSLLETTTTFRRAHHQVAVWVDTKDKYIQVLDSKAAELSPASKARLCALLGLPAGHVIMDTKPKYIQNNDDNWSCGVHVVWILAEYAGMEVPLLADQMLDLIRGADILYRHYQTQTAREAAVGEVQAENTRQTQVLLNTIEDERHSLGFYLAKVQVSGDVFKPVADFLQLIIWGNLDRQLWDMNGEQKGRKQQASKANCGKSLAELWREYQKDNPKDDYGSLILGMASLPHIPKDISWPILFGFITAFHQAETSRLAEASDASPKAKNAMQQSIREIHGFLSMLCEETQSEVKSERFAALLWQLVARSAAPKKAIKQFIKAVYPADEVKTYINNILIEPRVYMYISKEPLNETEAQHLIYLLLTKLSAFELRRVDDALTKDRRLLAERASATQATAVLYETFQAHLTTLGFNEPERNQILDKIVLKQFSLQLLSAIVPTLQPSFVALPSETKVSFMRMLLSLNLPLVDSEVQQRFASLSAADSIALGFFGMSWLTQLQKKGIVRGWYDLSLMLELPVGEDGYPMYSLMQPNTMYVQKDRYNTNRLYYLVNNPLGNAVEGHINIRVNGDLTSETLRKLRSAILTVTSARGHTHHVAPLVVHYFDSLLARLPSMEPLITAEQVQALTSEQRVALRHRIDEVLHDSLGMLPASSFYSSVDSKLLAQLFAVTTGHIGFIQQWLSAENQHFQVDYLCETWHLASRFKQLQMLRFLIRYPAVLDSTNDMDETALCVACRDGDRETVKLLLDNDANMYIPDISGHTAWSIALQHTNKSIASILRLYEMREQLRAVLRLKNTPELRQHSLTWINRVLQQRDTESAQAAVYEFRRAFGLYSYYQKRANQWGIADSAELRQDLLRWIGLQLRATDDEHARIAAETIEKMLNIYAKAEAQITLLAIESTPALRQQVLGWINSAFQTAEDESGERAIEYAVIRCLALYNYYEGIRKSLGIDNTTELAQQILTRVKKQTAAEDDASANDIGAETEFMLKLYADFEALRVARQLENTTERKQRVTLFVDFLIENKATPIAQSVMLDVSQVSEFTIGKIPALYTLPEYQLRKLRIENTPELRQCVLMWLDRLAGDEDAESYEAGLNKFKRLFYLYGGFDEIIKNINIKHKNELRNYVLERVDVLVQAENRENDAVMKNKINTMLKLYHKFENLSEAQHIENTSESMRQVIIWLDLLVQNNDASTTQAIRYVVEHCGDVRDNLLLILLLDQGVSPIRLLDAGISVETMIHLMMEEMIPPEQTSTILQQLFAVDSRALEMLRTLSPLASIAAKTLVDYIRVLGMTYRALSLVLAAGIPQVLPRLLDRCELPELSELLTQAIESEHLSMANFIYPHALHHGLDPRSFLSSEAIRKRQHSVRFIQFLLSQPDVRLSTTFKKQLFDYGIWGFKLGKREYSPRHGIGTKMLAELHNPIAYRAGEQQDLDGLTALMYAARRGALDIVALLLKAGAKMEVKNTYGWTPLWLAVLYGHVDVVGAFIAAGANIEAANHWGWTPLWIAARCGYVAIVKQLLNAGAKIEVQDDHKRTPLMMAASNGHFDTVQAFIDARANIEVRDEHGRTPLMMAASNGHLDTVQTLLRSGAYPYHVDENGCTALTLAFEAKADTFLLLMKHQDIYLIQRDARTMVAAVFGEAQRVLPTLDVKHRYVIEAIHDYIYPSQKTASTVFSLFESDNHRPAISLACKLTATILLASSMNQHMPDTDASSSATELRWSIHVTQKEWRELTQDKALKAICEVHPILQRILVLASGNEPRASVLASSNGGHARALTVSASTSNAEVLMSGSSHGNHARALAAQTPASASNTEVLVSASSNGSHARLLSAQPAVRVTTNKSSKFAVVSSSTSLPVAPIGNRSYAPTGSSR